MLTWWSRYAPRNQRSGLLDHRNRVEGNHMGFLKNLFGGATAKPEKHYYTFNVKCKRCGEILEGRVDLDNDLSLDDDGDGYLVRKTLMGSNRCFQQIEVE